MPYLGGGYFGSTGTGGTVLLPGGPSVLESTLTIVYATDEHVYLEGPADWGVIVPRSNRVSAGTDGVFASGTPWVLSSASNGFAGQGVASGMVVKLFGPAASFATPQYLAVDSAAANSVTLRRCGLGSGVGLAPGVGGLTSVSFEILTLLPQIENTAFALHQQFSIDPNLVNRRPEDMYDQRIFRRLTSLRVLYLQYMALNRSRAGDFADKQQHYHDEYERELAAAVVKWGPLGTRMPPTTRFSTRLSR